MRGLLRFPKLNEVRAEMVDRRSGEVFICLALFFLLFGCTVGQEVSVFRLERLALLQLRSSLGLRAREWPIKSDPCSSWVGIRCTGGRVTGINISGFRRTRRGSHNPQFSVDALRNLTLLSSFNASNFPLPGSIPEWFGLQVGALELLDLRSCSINGAIPPTLGNLSGLNELYLSHNSLTSIIPSSLTQLTSLSVLDLSQNRLTGQIPSAIATLRNLTLLDLSSNFLSDSIPPVIGTFSRLQFLNLSRNSFSSSVPPQLGSLSGLVDLDLSFNSLSGFLPPTFEGLRNMRRLIIGSNFLTGRLPDALWSIQALQFLDVSVNNFTGTLPSATPSPGLNNDSASVLNISQNQFYGNITPLISRFTSIDMSGNYFEGLVPIYAQGHTSLDRNCLRNSTAQRSLADCVSFYVERNLIFDNFGQPNVSPPPRPGRRRRSVILLASIFGGIGLIVLLLLLIIFLIVWKHKRAHMSPRGVISMEPPAPAGGGNPLPARPLLDLTNLGDTLTYEKILEATNELNDSNLLRNGHSGDLYRGVLDGGVHIVVKKFDQSLSVKKESYYSELEVFSKVSHARLVPLLGHCLGKEDKKFLVYRNMPNGDLSSSLFRNVAPDGSLQSLDWITRLKIAIGAAEGLSYLHHECNPPLVHRDVQASSILLDDKFEVRLGSLSEVVAQEGDIHRSRITKFLRLPQSSDQGASGTPNSTCAYDVYCFGKVLLELVTGRLGISSPAADPTATKEWLDATLGHISIYDKDLLADILDPSLIIDEDHLEEVWAMAIVARSCLNPRPNRRPIMRYILKALENPLKVVRDEQRTGSDRLRTASSRGSWNATLFGSWRQSSSDVAAHPEAVVAVGATSGSKVERSSSGKRSRMSGSQGSGLNGDGNSNTNNNGNSSSARKSSKEIFPEPLEEGVI